MTCPVHATVHMYTEKVMFDKVSKITAMFKWSPCIITSTFSNIASAKSQSQNVHIEGLIEFGLETTVFGSVYVFLK